MNQALYLSVDVVALAQPAEHRIVDPKVTGSTPVGHPSLFLSPIADQILMTPTIQRITRTMMITPMIPTPPPLMFSLLYGMPERLCSS